MTFAMSLLARNPEWQEKLHAEVSQAKFLPLDEAESVANPKPLKFLPYEAMSNLPLVLAAAVETLRMRDMAMQLTRVASRDTTLDYRTWECDASNAAETKVREHTIAIPAGTRVHLDMAAFGVNPFKWEDPDVYNPTRHLRETDDVNGKKMTVRFPSPLYSDQVPKQALTPHAGHVPGLSRLLGRLASMHWQALCRGDYGVLPGPHGPQLPLGGRAQPGRDPGAGQREGVDGLGTVRADTAELRSAHNQTLRVGETG